MTETKIPIPGFPHYYITPTGDVYNKDGKKLSPYQNAKGYRKVDLMTDGQRSKQLVHRLVARAYIPNPLGLPMINHKDENPSNNCVDNLEWCDAKYNANYGSHLQRISEARKGIPCSEEVKRKLSLAHRGKAPVAASIAAKKRNSKPVAQKENGKVIATYPSANEAGRETGVNFAHICDCCRGERKTAGGYTWEYINKEVVL